MRYQQLKKERQAASQRERLDKLLLPYPCGLTRTEIEMLLAAESVKPVSEHEEVSLGVEREAVSEHTLLRYPRAVRGVGRYSPMGEFRRTDSPGEMPITYLVNREFRFRSAEDKKRVSSGDFAHENYSVACKPFREAVEASLLAGHQFIPGGFYRTVEVVQRKPTEKPRREIKVRTMKNLSYLQVLITEWDKPLSGYQSIEEIAERHPFLSENAALVTESVSGFPKGRAFFVLPTFATERTDIDFLLESLYAEFTELGEELDKSGSKPTNGAFGRVGMRHIWVDKFLSGDVLARWKEAWDKKPKPKSVHSGVDDGLLNDLSTEHREAISKLAFNSSGWSTTKIPCPWSNHEHDSFGGLSNGTAVKLHDGGAVTLRCFKCGGKSKTYRRRARLPILKRVSDNDRNEVSIEKVRAEMGEDGRVWLKKTESDGQTKHLLVLQQDTGSGKTEFAISSVENLLHISPTKVLADEVCARATEMGKETFRWRARDDGFDDALAAAGLSRADLKGLDEDGRARFADVCFSPRSDGKSLAMCAYSDWASVLLERGHRMPTSLCGLCPEVERCKRVAFLSQFGDAQISKHVFMSFLEIAVDLRFAQWATELQAVMERVAIIDDASPDKLSPRRLVKLSEVRDMLKSRAGESASVLFLKNFEGILEVEELSAQSALTALELNDGEAVADQLSKVQIAIEKTGRHVFQRLWKGKRRLTLKQVSEVSAVSDGVLADGVAHVHIDVETALKSGFFTPDTLPRVSDNEFGWVRAMLTENALVRKTKTDKGERALEIVLPPNLNFKRTIAMSATTARAEWEALFSTDTNDDKPTVVTTFSGGSAVLPWQDGCKVYQVNRAKYTDRSFFDMHAGEVVGPGPRLGDVVKILQKTLTSGLSVVFFGRLGMQDLLMDGLSSGLSGVELERFEFVNYAQAIGRNDLHRFDCAVATLPSPSVEALMSRCASRYRADFHDLDFDTRADGLVKRAGFELETTVFTDGRVQAVAEEIIEEDLRQALARLRPQLFEDKIFCLLTAWPVKGYTDRAIFVSIEDLLASEDIREIKPTRSVKERLDAGEDVQSIGDATGVSLQRVYKVKGKVDKAERDAEVRAAAAGGKSQLAISKETGLSRNTVRKILTG